MGMKLELLKTALQTAEARALHRRMTTDAWATDQDIRADKVRLFREYAEGDHRAELTGEMRKMLRISSSDATRFNDNYMDIVIQTMNDRLKLQSIDTDNDAGTEWIASLMEANRFDALQGDVHEAAIRDGDTYVMASWDDTAKRVVWTHEPAFDGSNGVLVVPGPDNTIQAAMKVWTENASGDSPLTLTATMHINVYYADHVEKYISLDGGALRPVDDPAEARQAWMVKGEPIGVPIVHIPNRGTTYDFYGLSEIENAIPLQDALNRTLYSMVMTAELTGFPVRWTKGVSPIKAIMPGAIIDLTGGQPLTKEDVVEIGVLEQGEIMPYIQQAQWLTSEIGKITRTPAPEFASNDASSGEALKQREIGLIGKVRRFQTRAGNRWEDLTKLSWRIESALGSTPPDFATLAARWADAELRNETTIVQNAKVLAEMGLVKEALRQMAGAFGWDSTKVDELYDEWQAQKQSELTALAGNLNLPTFDTMLSGVNL